MNWFTGLLVYGVLWWLIFLLALPVGVKSQDESEESTVPGTPGSAPEKPQLLQKIVATTVIAAVAWGLIYLVISQGWISIRG